MSHALARSFYGFMSISARSKLRGTVDEINGATSLAHIVVRVGEIVTESVITRRSAKELKLKKGDTVLAVPL